MVQREAILKGNITGVFFRYVTPGVIGMVGMSLYILADTYFIANGVGRLGLAALNIGLPAYNLIFGIGALLGIGGGTVFSILHGRGELGPRQSSLYDIRCARHGVFPSVRSAGASCGGTDRFPTGRNRRNCPIHHNLSARNSAFLPGFHPQ